MGRVVHLFHSAHCPEIVKQKRRRNQEEKQNPRRQFRLKPGQDGEPAQNFDRGRHANGYFGHGQPHRRRITHHHRIHSNFLNPAQQENHAQQNTPDQGCNTSRRVRHVHAPLFNCIQLRARFAFHARSNNSTSEDSFASARISVSFETAAPSPAFNSTPFTLTAPRVTCTHAWRPASISRFASF